MERNGTEDVRRLALSIGVNLRLNADARPQPSQSPAS
jgi:hypothetical protein